MGRLIPNARPQMSREDCERIIKFYGIDRDKFPVCVIAVRGYFMDTMGAPGKNDRGIYDDAAFVCSPNVFSAVNWNTDPSSERKGSGTGGAKGMANLDGGVWDYQVGQHKKIFPAGVQAGPVRVIRDGNPPYSDTGYFGINHHPGSSVGTSSLGCQTAPPNQFASYIGPIVSELKRYGKKVYKYILITESQMHTILNKMKDDEAANHAPIGTAEQSAQAGEVIPISIPAKIEPAPVKSEHDMHAAVVIIKEFEGFFAKAYRDPVGIPTIGWGTIQYPDGRKVQMGDTCTEAQATEWLLFEMNAKSKAISDMVKVSLNDNEFCALTSFAYNCGIGAFKTSTLLRKLNSGSSKSEVANELLKWVYAGGKVLNGLVRRRKEERELFLHGVNNFA